MGEFKQAGGEEASGKAQTGKIGSGSFDLRLEATMVEG
jgi:hypothetical protein